MALLTEEENRRITSAVTEAEAATGGEIVAAIIPQSDDYAGPELLFATAVGIITFIAASLGASGLSVWLDARLWIDSPAVLPLTVGALSLAAGTLAYIIAQIPVLDRLIVGRRRMERAVRSRALRHFTESAAYDTVDRTGVLLFLSVLEHRVELIADRGINDAVAPDTWDRIVSALVRGLKRGRTAESLESAIREIGTVLAEHVPPRPDDVNELSDGPTELERGS